MKKTHRKTKTNIPLTIGCMIFLIIIIIASALTLIYNIVRPASTDELDGLMRVLLIIICGFFLVLSGGGLLASLIGIARGMRFGMKISNKARRENPLKYFKELPNPYGIGIATILMDSQIENEKDIIAAILDLCAKGYLRIKYWHDDSYTIKVLTHDLSHLLQNERYIIEKIADNQIGSIDYHEWYAYCIEDGMGLGLWSQYEPRRQPARSSGGGVIKVLIDTYKTAYTAKLAEYLEPTPRGIEELKKLYAFRDFLKDFGNFKISNEAEVILWEYYLSYAVVFGLTDTILKTGYSRLVKNSAFEIDDFSKVMLKSIYCINE